MTTTLLFWIRLGIIAAILYTIGSWLLPFFKPRAREVFKSKKLSEYGGDIFFIAVSVFLLYYLQTNFQKTFNSVLDTSESTVTDFRFRESRTGIEKTTSDYSADLLLINYWATWCGPCRKELPDLNELYTIFPGEKLQVLAISDEEPGTVENFLAGKNYQLVTGTITRTNNILASVQQRPVSILVSREGKVLDMIVGSRGLSFFKGWINTHLNRDSSAGKN